MFCKQRYLYDCNLQRKAIKVKIVLFQIQYLLAHQEVVLQVAHQEVALLVAHQEVVLLVALHQAPNHMVLRVAQVVLPLPAVPQVVPGVHTALREVAEVFHHHRRTLQLDYPDEDELYNQQCYNV